MSSVTFLISSLMFTDETFPIDSGVIVTNSELLLAAPWCHVDRAMRCPSSGLAC